MTTDRSNIAIAPSAAAHRFGRRAWLHAATLALGGLPAFLAACGGAGGSPVPIGATATSGVPTIAPPSSTASGAVATVIRTIPSATTRASATVSARPAAVDRTPTPEELVGLFAYDPVAPFDLREGATSEQGNATVRDLDFASPRGGRVPATLVLPTGGAPRGAVVFMHGGEGGKDEFLAEATELAAAGLVGLLLDSPNRRPPYPPLFSFTARDRELFLQCAVDLRRGVDLLLARGDIPTDRLAFAGRSYGGVIGAMLTGVERRFRAFALASTGARESAFLRVLAQSSGRSTAEVEAYVAAMRVTDAVLYVGRAAPAALLIQNGTRDAFITRADAEELHTAASDPKVVRWYDAPHALNDEARRDRIAWLRTQLLGTSAATR